jgi:hypothetical protein
MSEEKNIPGKKSKEKSEKHAEHFPAKTHAQQPQTTNLSAEALAQADNKPETENMEVHKHSHHVTHKKKWGEYILEFFMLFLAVFLGFIAENQREHYVDKRKEIVYVRGILRDLVTDTINFSQFISKTLENESRIDSLISLLKTYKSSDPTEELYYLARTLFGRIERLQYNKRTYDQLKSSGSLRLIHHQLVLDSVSKYFESLQWIDLQNQLQIERQTLYGVQLGEIFDAWTIDSVFNVDFSKPVTSPPLLTSEKRDLNRFVMRLHILKGVVLFNMRRVANDFLPNSKKLIALIKEEYHLE